MRLLKPATLALLLAQAAPALLAQVPTAPVSAATTTRPPTELSLEAAIATARQNNPQYLQTVNSRRTADAQVRSAYGALLPSSSASFGTRYQQGGTIFTQGASVGVSSDQLQSNYSLGLSYSLNSATLLAPQAAKATRAAADADITGASELLRSTVTQQYITALQAADNASLQDTLVETARGQLELAKARVAVGAATILDTRRAEVTLGQAEVAALTAHNSAAVEKLRLFQQIGINAPDSVVLSTKFAVARPSFSLDSVLDLARRVNPAVHALRERERASGWNVRMQQSQYTPTLSVFTGWGGNSFQYTNFDPILRQDSIGTMLSLASCLGSDSIRTRVSLPSIASACYSRFSLTSADMQAARDQNRAFPFRFTRAPFSLSAQVSIPVFDNFSREQRIEQAQVDRDNARFSVRAQELQLTGDVTQDYLNLVTAERTVELQEVNAQAAREELAFAEERYRVGAATFLDVTTSHGTFAQAQVDRLKAIYDYHRAFAALESAVGRPLR